MDDEETVAAPVSTAPTLTITVVGDDSYTVEPADGPITIGRVFPAQIVVDDARISRIHLRLECTGAQWMATDHSKNGVFLDRRSVSSVNVTNGLTLHLGHPEGIEAHFALVDPGADGSSPMSDAGDVDDFDDDDADESGEHTAESDYTDPGIARAGAAVAARRRELGIAQRTLARDRVVNAGTLIGFEKGRSWPRQSTLTKLEEVLGWSAGEITRLRWGQDPQPRDAAEETVVLTNTDQAPFMAQAFEIALNSIRSQITILPPESDADFAGRVAAVLADLRRLDQVVGNAARSATGAPDVVLVLSAVRRQYRDLMLQAARSPQATMGQLLFAARHRAELSAQEAANAAGVSVDVVDAVESDTPMNAEVTAAITALLASLARS